MVLPRCNGCATCCKTMTLSGGDDLTRTRRAYVKDVVYKGQTHMVMNIPCRYLDPVTNKCTIYEERPTRCKEFPRGEEDFWKLVCPTCTMCP